MTRTPRPAARTARQTPIWLRILNWVADRDAAYRATQKLRSMPEDRLEDMGMSRRAANAAFYGRGSRRADHGASVRLTAFRKS
ncbi:hypothetical protein [Pseudodonghicola flavimaris]|uniref:DUF1127 domain-containing protein n=1 Tax=Pseudodonghicola flavimaris TaxID=3050036 RepID=A0ABT7F185_9RHOB|nr:hypothetical protein [Pseudodonghicola flavimaris]MDK3018373.1 hypothetical protein [Pseudodonghicola flavimaris]